MPPDTLVVAMATYNGAAFLGAQLESIAAQTRTPDLLLVSDDGSQDGTRAILADFARAAPFDVRIHDGPCRGSGRNFASLFDRVPDGTDWLALCDQDDVWFPDKLARACETLSDVTGPGLYGARSLETSKDLTDRRLSRGMGVAPSFRHALARNFAGGNTMLLNAAGVDLLRVAAQRLTATPIHDWWVYQIVTGCGGTAVFDDQPSLLYRQHRGSEIGSNTGVRAISKRIRDLRDGRYRDWTDANIANLEAMRDHLTPANVVLLNDLKALRALPVIARARAFARTGIHRDGTMGRIGMWASVLMGRF